MRRAHAPQAAPAKPTRPPAPAPAADNPRWRALALAADHPLEAAADRAADGLVARTAGTPAADAADAADPGALAPGFRQAAEAHLGVPLGGVRLHTTGAAAAAADDRDARALATGRDIAFAPGQFRPDAADGRRLIAHELAHVAQQARGEAPFGAVQRDPRPRSRQPFERVLDLHRQEVETLDLVTEVVDTEFDLSPWLMHTGDIADAARDDAGRANRVVDAYAAGQDIRDEDFGFDTANYVMDNRPSATGLGLLERKLRTRVAVADLIRPQLLALSATVDRLPPDTPPAVSDAVHQLAGHYVDILLPPTGPPDFAQFAFLAALYQDPGVVVSYGLVFHMKGELPATFDRLNEAGRGGEYTVVFGTRLEDLGTSSESSIRANTRRGWQGKRGAALMIAGNQLHHLREATAAVGDEIPLQLAPGRAVLTPAAAADLVRLYNRTEAQIDILSVWQAVDPIRSIIRSHNAIGTSLNPLVGNDEDDRTRWLDYLLNLEITLTDEFDRDPHTGLVDKLTTWHAELRVIYEDVQTSARRWHTAKAIAEQLPFMFVAGATVLRVGMWARAATTSRALVALAEGATMTALTALVTPPGQSQAMGAGGWAWRLVTNVALSFVGRLVFERAGVVAEKLGTARLAIVDVTARVAVPIAGMTVLQTAVQMVEAKAMNQGGESSFTELLTINLLLNGVGLVLGAAAMPDPVAPAPPPAPGTALATRPAAAVVRPTPADLARRLDVPEDVARAMLEVFDRVADFAARCRAINELAARGRLTPEQFERMRREGNDTADFIEPRLVAVADAGRLGGRTAAQARGFTAAMRAALAAMTYEARPRVTAVLPQNVEGLTATPDATTWAYDQARPPPRLPALRTSLEGRGYTVRAQPSGGFDATSTGGAPPVRVLALPAAALRVTRTLPELARGRVTATGLAAVRAQTGVPVNVLEAQLATAAAAAGGERAVPTLLQNLGRFVDPNNARAWQGLNNFLARGGDVGLLGRKLAYGSPRENAAESRALANRLLELAAGWDNEAVAGFAALYRVRPNLTAERLHNLVGGTDFTPGQTTGILQTLALLEPRSRGLGQVVGPLTSGSESSARGAMGTLTAAVRLAAEFPDGTLVFEAPVTDATGAVTRRTDIRVVELQRTRVAGQERVVERLVGKFEQKEVSTRSLGRRSPQELARDIAEDARLRALRPAPAAGSRPFFETFRWQIRRVEFEARALRATGATDPADPAVAAEMRRAVEAELAPALERPEFRALPQAEQDGYRAAFRGVPFVEFF